VLDFSLPGDVSFLSKEWQKCLSAFLEDIYERSHSVKSLRLYRGMVLGFFRMVKKSPDACTRNDVQAFMRSPCKSPGSRGRAPTVSTRNARLDVLASFWRFAALFFERVVHNPTLGLRRAKRQRPDKKRAFSDEELARFLSVIPEETIRGSRDYALFSMYIWTGRRRSEICRLRYGDIEPCVFVEDGIPRPGWRFRYFGKGHGQEALYQELPPVAKAALDRYLLKSGRLSGMQVESPLFIAHGSDRGGGRRSTIPNAPLHSDTVRDNFKRYLAKAGLDTSRLSVHSLRHTAAQAHWLAKPDLFLLQHFLGHASVATTQLYVGDLFGESDPVSRLLEEKFARLGLR
jgi:integrase/recombinase XerD